MILTDSHMHSRFSADSDASMHEMIEKSIDKGLKHITFTEHMDYDFPKEYNLLFEFDLDSYFKEIANYKNFYKNDIDIHYGIEIGLMPHLGKQYNKLLNSYEFDFVIASSHLVYNKDPYYPDFWEGISEEDGYTKYFESLYENICIYENFDVYGHLDYIVRYGPNKNKNYSYEKYQSLIEPILKKIIELGKGIEVNSAGYKYGLDTTNPSLDVLKKYKEFGGKIITIGSDAHCPEHIAYDFEKTANLIKCAGFNEYAFFTNRTPIMLSL